MQLMYETLLQIKGRTGKMHAVQQTPRMHPEPVVVGDTQADLSGVSIYGTVLHDGGRYRMWYQALPADYVSGDSFDIAYAESDDGVHWRKPKMTQTLVESQPSHLLDLHLHCPSVFIDPEAEPSKRYWLSGWRKGKETWHGPESGYFLASSPDGLHWTLDEGSQIGGADVITSVYHPGWRCGVTALKHKVYFRGLSRREIWTATVRGGRWSEPAHALMSDDFDDLCGVVRGAHMADYYGMGLMPVGQGMVGFLWRYCYRLGHFSKAPGRPPETVAFGDIDVALAYQTGPNDRWLQPSGRQDFLRHQDVPWGASIVHTASTPIEVGDEHRIYFSSRPPHGWQQGLSQADQDAAWRHYRSTGGMSKIGFVSWPKWRLFGWKSESEGQLALNLGKITKPTRLRLNYECEPCGRVEAEVSQAPGRTFEEGVPLTGSQLSGKVQWRDGGELPVSPNDCIVNIRLVRATLWAFEKEAVART